MTFIGHHTANCRINFECYIISCRNKLTAIIIIKLFPVIELIPLSCLYNYIVLYVMKLCINYHDNPSAREKYSLICFIK